MTKVQLKKFRDMLEARRQEIIKRAQQTLDEDMALDANDLPDDVVLDNDVVRTGSRLAAAIDDRRSAYNNTLQTLSGKRRWRLRICLRDNCGDKDPNGYRSKYTNFHI